MKKTVLIISLIIETFSLNLNAIDVIYGNVAYIVNRKPVVVRERLPSFSGGFLKNDMLHFSEIPVNLAPDSNGNFLYEINDERFFYVQIYFFASQIVSDYNSLSLQLGLPLVKNITINVKKNLSGKCAMDASAHIDTAKFEISLQKPSSAMDYTTIAHELAHVIHYVSRGEEGISGEDVWTKWLVNEGSANILAALHLRTPLISGRSLSINLSPNVDTFVKFPDQFISWRDVAKMFVNDSFVNEICPEISAGARDLLIHGDPEFLERPQEYWSSAAINQPLWHASFDFGNVLVKKVYLKTIADFTTLKHYSDLAKAIITTANKFDRSLAEYLKSEYQKRGLLD